MTESCVIVTGANRGIGRGIAAGLAQQNRSVIMACHDTAAAHKTLREISAKTNNAHLRVEELDLASFASIRRFAERILEQNLEVEVLINNAGVLLNSFEQTQDGFEKTLQVNFLGPALLTFLLLPVIKKGTGKILYTSSLVYKFGTIKENVFNQCSSSYNKFSAYADSKLALLLFALKLGEILRPAGISAVSIDPGIVNTKIITMNNKLVDSLSNVFFRPFIKTEHEGAQGFVELSARGSGALSEYYIGTREKKLSERYTTHAKKDFLWKAVHQIIGIE